MVNEYLSLQAQIDLGAGATGPNGVAVIPSTGRVVVTNRQTSNARVIDPVAGTVVGNIPTGSMPDGVIIQGGYGYIANFGSDSVTVFDPATLAVVTTLTNVGHEPAMLAAGDPGSDEVFLTSHGSNQVFHLRGSSVLGHWDGVAAPYGISYDPASRRLYVANRGPAHMVTVIDVYARPVVGNHRRRQGAVRTAGQPGQRAPVRGLRRRGEGLRHLRLVAGDQHPRAAGRDGGDRLRAAAEQGLRDQRGQ